MSSVPNLRGRDAHCARRYNDAIGGGSRPCITKPDVAVKKPAAYLLLLSIVWPVEILAGADGPAGPKTLEELVARVREQEALFVDLDVTIKTSWQFHPDPQPPRRGMGFGPRVADSVEATIHCVRSGEQLFAARDEVVSLTSGTKLRGRSLAVSDGMQTVAIDDNNSATVFRRRYEPAWVLPPHSWPLFPLEVNFPLSLYLQGTEAIKASPKVPRTPIERGSAFEFNKVESAFLGTDSVGELRCVKVQIQRWHYTRDPPIVQYLWLAKDRNYHVAQVQTVWTRNGRDIPGDAMRREAQAKKEEAERKNKGAAPAKP